MIVLMCFVSFRGIYFAEGILNLKILSCVFTRNFKGEILPVFDRTVKVLINPKWVIGDSDRAKKVSY